jgi:hypothetical protein
VTVNLLGNDPYGIFLYSHFLETFLIPKPDKPEITNYNIKISNKIESQLFRALNFSHWDLLFEIYLLLKPEHLV